MSDLVEVTRTVSVGPIIVKFCITSMTILFIGFFIYLVSLTVGLLMSILIITVNGPFRTTGIIFLGVYIPILGAVGIIFSTIFIIIPIVVTVIVIKRCLKHRFGIKLTCF